MKFTSKEHLITTHLSPLSPKWQSSPGWLAWQFSKDFPSILSVLSLKSRHRGYHDLFLEKKIYYIFNSAFYKCLHVCLCMWVGTPVLAGHSDDQGTAFRSQCSPSTMWILGLKSGRQTPLLTRCLTGPGVMLPQQHTAHITHLFSNKPMTYSLGLLKGTRRP